VRVNIAGVTAPKAILIPKRALSQGPQGPFVFVVTAENAASTRPVRIDREVPDGFIVREGLKAGERIVVDGVIRVRPGAPVKPVAATAAAPGKAAPPGAAPASAPAPPPAQGAKK
jgi:membrane fusion protein (multidrug efflux system)